MKTIVFTDENGNSSLNIDKPGTSSHFIVCAIIIDEKDFRDIEDHLTEIGNNHFGGKEIKSSSISNNQRGIKRRIKILKKISLLNFSYYILAVDKSKILLDSGLRFKETFIKNINNKVYSKIFKSSKEVLIYADQHGDENFIKSLIDYVSTRNSLDLFENATFTMTDSRKRPGIQLADFIAGTAQKVLIEGIRDLIPHWNELRKKQIGYNVWPRHLYISNDSQPEHHELDQVIKNYCLERGDQFIEENANNFSDESVMQTTTLSHLLYVSEWVDGTLYVPSSDLINHLKNQNLNISSDQVLRSNIISKLRDKGVIIASSQKGYKIPTSVSDIKDYIRIVDSHAVPQIRRAKSVREDIKMLTKNNLDLIPEEELPLLSQYTDIE